MEIYEIVNKISDMETSLNQLENVIKETPHLGLRTDLSDLLPHELLEQETFLSGEMSILIHFAAFAQNAAEIFNYLEKHNYMNVHEVFFKDIENRDVNYCITVLREYLNLYKGIVNAELLSGDLEKRA